LDAIVVALDLLHEKKFPQKSIVLFSEMCGQFSDDQLDHIVDAMKNESIDFAAM